MIGYDIIEGYMPLLNLSTRHHIVSRPFECRTQQLSKVHYDRCWNIRGIECKKKNQYLFRFAHIYGAVKYFVIAIDV